MRIVLSVLFWLMLLTSLVGVSYAAPTLQPTGNGNPCNPSSPNYTGACGPGRNIDPPHHGCRIDIKGPDNPGCCASITPSSLEVSDKPQPAGCVP